MQSRLGGEVSLSKTLQSPELAFDTTLVELTRGATQGIAVGRYGILEVQTMDFHGSYSGAVRDLEDALRLHGVDLPSAISQHPEWLSKGLEGPNIANAFKRTLYQIILKFGLSGHAACAGAALAVPAAVWDSWQRHFGGPTPVKRSGGTYELFAPGHVPKTPSWLYVFDVDSDSKESPNPIVIKRIIATDADSIAHYAFKVVPEAAIAAGGSADRVLSQISARLQNWWPNFGRD